MTPLHIAGMVIGAQALLIYGAIRVIRNMVAERERIDTEAAIIADAEAFVRRALLRIEAGQ